MSIERRSITVWRRIFHPWEADADEPELKAEHEHRIDLDDLIDDEEVSVQAAAAFLSGKRHTCTVWFAAVEASVSGPGVVIDHGVWYADEPYTNPYSGEIEEQTAHLNGFTDAEARQIHRMVLAPLP
ncbi:hypothetical protein [Glycomyces tenuis]|uniref:hypothetical protein n=1 Tax=Glycomyces tenuis TaxID=58116 RepID=UPI000406D52F|nr:hypothetical protein [Glycomyces tenuis]